MNKLEVKDKLKDNKLPEGWVKVKLGSLLIESKERNITNKKLLVFSITNKKVFVLQDEYFSHNIHSKKTTNYKVFRENYFGYNPARINVGSIALSEKQREGLLSPMYVIFKTKSTLNPKYLKYFLQTSHFKNNVINNVAGSVRECLNYSFLEMFDFIYPILITEQNKIAEILEIVEETIEKNDAIIEKYKRIKQGLMQDLLTRGITAFEFEKDKLIAAVKKVFKNGDHRFGREENLVSHLSRHLNEFFPGWDVDSEVEKNNERQRSDIIIHKRRMDENLFAIEIKKNDNLNAIKQDIEKLEDVMLEDYHYEDAIFVGFDIENFEDVFKLSEKVNFILVSKNGEIKVKSRIRSFKDSSLGRIPEEWKVVELGEVGKIITGSTPSTERTEYYGEDYPFISPEDINYEKYVNKSVKMLSKLGFKISRKIPPKSICVVCIGSTIGKVSLTIEETTTNQQINTIVSNRKMYDPDGLYYFTLFYIQKPLRIEAGLQAVPIVNKSKFAKIKIPIPPLPEQHYIASILSQIDETIEKEQKYREKLERIKQGLMEDLLAGEIRTNHLIKEGVESV